MASINDLPTEVLVPILRFVGFGEFRKQRGCCLTVSKGWYEIAREIIFEDIVLPIEALMSIPEDESDESRAKYHPYVEKISVELDGGYQWDIQYRTLPNTPRKTGNMADLFWEENLSSSLEGLIASIPDCPRLTSLSIQAWKKRDSSWWSQCLIYWSPKSLSKNLPLSKVSDLVLDTCGSELYGEHSWRRHNCVYLARCIPSLRSVRIRMGVICPRIFEFPSETTVDSRLERLVVNIYLKEQDLEEAAENYSTHCIYRRRVHLYSEMITAATTAAVNFPRIEEMSIISRKADDSDFMSHDCITGEEMAFSKLEDWK